MPEIEAHTRKAVKLVLASPAELQRYTTEFYTLARSVRGDQERRDGGGASFEQLVELGRSNKPLDANDQGVVGRRLAVQYAFDQRASDIHLEPGARPPGRSGFASTACCTRSPAAARRDER